MPVVEQLSVNKQWAPNDRTWLFLDTDLAHGVDVTWDEEPSAKKMPGSFQPMVTCSYKNNPQIRLKNQSESFKVHELVVASSDKERTALAKHRMVRLLAPHVQETPMFFHMVHSDSASVRLVLDQMAEIGFDMMIYSFGSKFDIESENETYIKQMTADIAYANSKGIEVGGYDMISWTRSANIPTKWKAIDPITQKPTSNACMASGWYDHLLEKMLTFINRTGLSMIETDGPYGGVTEGFPCAAQNHDYHEGLSDAVYYNTIMQGKMFTKLRMANVYINQPDTYFYQGGNKDG